MDKIYVRLRPAAEGPKLEIELPAEVLDQLRSGVSVELTPDDADEIEVEGIEDWAGVRINWP